MPKIALLVSGTGSNLQRIIDAVATKELNCELAVVIADRDCYALSRAASANINYKLLERKVYRADLSAQISAALPKDCDLIVLAGFLSILDRDFIARWENKIINLHPSLLPKFGGAGMWGNKVHQAVIAAAEEYSGCTVHYVNNQIDGGEIIAQQVVALAKDETVETLQQKIQLIEHITLIQAIKQILN